MVRVSLQEAKPEGSGNNKWWNDETCHRILRVDGFLASGQS